MKLTEKMSYLQGLLDGLELDRSTKEGKALLQMSEVISELVSYVEDLQNQVDELTELCDVIDEDLGQVEDDFYKDFDGFNTGKDDFDCGNCKGCLDTDEDISEDSDEDEDFGFDDEDEELYEVTCPTCGDTILIDEGMMEEGSISCPNCNELLTFDYDDITLEDIESLDSGSEEKENQEEND